MKSHVLCSAEERSARYAEQLEKKGRKCGAGKNARRFAGLSQQIILYVPIVSHGHNHDNCCLYEGNLSRMWVIVSIYHLPFEKGVVSVYSSRYGIREDN